MASEVLVWLGCYAVTAAFLIPGIAAYRGIWRRWVLQQWSWELGKHSNSGFFMFYSGMALAITTTGAIITVLGAPQFVTDAFLLLAALAAVPAVASVFRLFPDPANRTGSLDTFSNHRASLQTTHS